MAIKYLLSVLLVSWVSWVSGWGKPREKANLSQLELAVDGAWQNSNCIVTHILRSNIQVPNLSITC